jgi:hypothetical protein
LITPKAFATLSPGFERSENPGNTIYKSDGTLKGFLTFVVADPMVLASSNHGLKLANTFGVISNLNYYPLF